MAVQEPLRLSIQSHGVMSVLTEPLRSSSSQVQSRAALTVAAFGCDANARSEVKVFSKIGIVCKNSESWSSYYTYWASLYFVCLL